MRRAMDFRITPDAEFVVDDPVHVCLVSSAEGTSTVRPVVASTSPLPQKGAESIVNPVPQKPTVPEPRIGLAAAFPGRIGRMLNEKGSELAA